MWPPQFLDQEQTHGADMEGVLVKVLVSSHRPFAVHPADRPVIHLYIPGSSAEFVGKFMGERRGPWKKNNGGASCQNL